QSRHDKALELSCQLALNGDERVESFAYFNGKERVVGEVLEKQAAAEVYQSLTEVERDPGLLEQEGERFRFRVYPVAPAENKRIDLGTLAHLRTERGWVELRLPKENLPAGQGRFELSVDLSDPLPIEAVQVHGARAQVQRKHARWVQVQLAQDGFQAREDVRIRYRLRQDDYRLSFLAHKDDGAPGSFMLRLSPKEGQDKRPRVGRDLVFVTDISGSMGGEPLAQSKRGLASMIQRLSPKDRFEVIAFESENHPVFGKLRRATPAAKTKAKQAVAALGSTGSTAIHGALRAAIHTLRQGTRDRPRAILFLTDGQGDTPPAEILASMRQEARSVRIFAVGVGDGVHRPFLKRLAENNRGSVDFVHDAGALARALTQLSARIAMPLLTDLHFSSPGLQLESVYPKHLPDLYQGSSVVLYGRFRAPGQGTVQIRGKLGGKSIRLQQKVTLPARETKHAYVEKLWAAARVDDLLATLALRGEDKELVQEVTRLGIVYNLLTPYTSFLAVPESLQSEAIKEAIRTGKRGYSRKLIDSLQGLQLSQHHFPPGDPVLSVLAPQDAKSVTAYFPFGLIKPLRWDHARQRWSVRFLVPKQVQDGVYAVRVRIQDKHGRAHWRDIHYTIDSAAPEFDAQVPQHVQAGQPLALSVDPFEAVWRVEAYWKGRPATRIWLKLDPDSGLYHGALPAPSKAGARTLHIVVRDLARNRHVREYGVQVIKP
ncbi:MAG: VWA domain-containing protein, partial [Polyangiales bacterium]